MSPDTPPPSLEHPLPAGMRDLLPEEAAARRDLSRAMLDRFALHGYALVTPPVFEFAEVLERGLGTLDPADVLRFVEPESGEVAALRPDMTPQIARMVATRLRDRPLPYRLGYEGTVMRRLSGRARKQRQIPQVGVELVGVPGPEGDLELIALAVDALRAAVARKDDAEIAEACAASGAPYADALRALPRLNGGRDALLEGVACLARTPAAAASARLLALFDRCSAAGLGASLAGDLGEVRGFAYYTGTVFHVYAPGTGDALASGGRYDELLARFGVDAPAAGFAVDLDRAREALQAARVDRDRPARVVVIGGPADSRLAAFRGRGTAAVAIADRAAALRWARSWGFTHVLDGSSWLDPATGAAAAPPAPSAPSAEAATRGGHTEERGRT